MRRHAEPLYHVKVRKRACVGTVGTMLMRRNSWACGNRRATACGFTVGAITRWTKPDEIARVIRWLCSDEAAIISGAAIPVYGQS
jgi:NAD(P)-dependent dehydrogenase (short-subunit alcohol dehydrogenase family)